MKRLVCDVAIIGAGTAGLGAWSAATDAGAAAIIIEGGIGGTTCARVGCMPSKLLLEAAKVAHVARASSFVGVTAEPRVDGRAVMERVRRERDHFTDGVYEKWNGIPEHCRLRGRARFVAPTRLAVGNAEIEAKAVVIATGSTQAILPMMEPVRDRVLTNDTVFEMEDLPRSLAVVGAGSLGLEFALAFARLGTRVTLFDAAETIGGLKDPHVNAKAIASIGREVPLVLGVELTMERDGDAVVVKWDAGDGPRSERFDWVLAAAGRPPNLASLDLAASGLELDGKGIPAFDPATMRCGTSHTYIAGDVSGFRPVLHEASNSGRIAGRNAASPPGEGVGRGCALAMTFTDPSIAIVGPSFDKLDQTATAIGEASFEGNGRARIEGYAGGAIRVYADRSDGRLLGGAMVGPDAEHLGHLLAWAVDVDLKAHDALALPFYHPTVEEALRGALRSLCAGLGVAARESGSGFDAPGA